MKVNDFPFDHFLKVKQARDKRLEDFILRGKDKIAIVQRPPSFFTRSICRYKEKQLESELDFLHESMKCQSDFMYSYLEPWVGVGIYAAAFGCPFEWNDHDAPQTRPIISTAQDLKKLNYKPDIFKCEPMIEVLERIRYFKELTGGQLDIALTDTQSPNDTASLIMDTCEFFVTSLTDFDVLEQLLQSITNTILEFSNLQIDIIGDCVTYPGHGMLSSRKISGLAISDDNIAVVSPAVYKLIGLPYNNQLSRQFGGIHLHSCGDFHQNYQLLKETEGITVIDCAVGKSADPNPNRINKLKEAFNNSKIILKVRIGSEEIDVLKDLSDANIRLIVQFTAPNGIEEGNRTYDMIQKIIR